MQQSDKWFRWSINMFVFLMCFQLGMLLFVKSLYYRAEQKLEKNKADVSFACGDFNTPEAYWRLPINPPVGAATCASDSCSDSYWNNSKEQPEELHVVSVAKPQPSRTVDGEQKSGYYVEVEVLPSAKPQRLVLVSQSMQQWNIKLADQVKNLREVIVVAKDLVWVEGLPEGVPLTYFSPEQICAHPVAWQEFANPENQFRRLLLALEEYTGQLPTSFQGEDVAQKIRVPRNLERSLASSEGKHHMEGENSISQKGLARQLSTGVQWLRRDQSIEAKTFQYFEEGILKKIDIPKAATDVAHVASKGRFFLIRNHQFGEWDIKTKQFKALHLPLHLQAMRWPRALTVDPQSGDVFVYNEDRGGEIYKYASHSKKWSLFAERVGYSLLALHFDEAQSMIYGTQFSAQTIDALVRIDRQGQKVAPISFRKPLRFAKNRWQVQILADEGDIWLKLIHPAHPGGDVYPLSQLKSL